MIYVTGRNINKNTRRVANVQYTKQFQRLITVFHVIRIKLSSYELQILMTHLKHRNVETLFERRIALFASRTYSEIINRIKKAILQRIISTAK